MKTMFKVLGSIVIITVLGFVFAGCPNSPRGSEPGSISGRAFFTSGENHAGINVTLEKTDGLLSQSAVSAVRSIEQGALSIVAARSIAGATQTATSGSYTFSNVAPGTYTIYASSQNSKEKAVAVNNVTVTAGKSVTASDLKLTLAGSITGQILLDNNNSGNSGFLVSVAGTSFMSVTDDAGNFTISDVPADNGYLIVIIKGSYTTTWTGSTVTVTGGQTLTLHNSPLKITSADMGNTGLQWRGELESHPSNPQLNWAYFNTIDRTSYIWNGVSWNILAAPGTSGSIISIGDNGNWFIDGVDTGMIAQGGAGAPGSVITIGANGNWFIDGVDTGEKAQGPQGEFGTPGSIVTIGDNGNWLINGVDTGVRVQGLQGDPGSIISIGDNGNWFIDGIDTGKNAQGNPGTPGSVITIGANGNWFIDSFDTGEKAQGPQGASGSIITIIEGNWHIDGIDTSVSAIGQKGTDGSTPIITIVEGYWYVDGVTTGVSAIGQKGADGSTPIISIVDGYWYVDGVTTGVSAIGQKGADGSTPVISIVDGYWYVDGVTTGISAIGQKGADGSTPIITIVDGYWYVDGVTTGVSAIGQKGEDGSTPVITIVDGYWYVDGLTTGVSAIGQKGTDGSTPVISIVDGYWHIDGVTTGISAIGQKGEDGSTPVITIVDGYWYVDGVTTGISAIGQKGTDGSTPIITIVDGNWYIDGVDTGVSAIGQKGADGSTPTITIVDGYWYVDGATTGVSAIGQKGADGSTPIITIVDGYWHIDGVTTGISAIGQKGADGSTPIITIVDGYWYVDGVTTGVSATIGQKGADGNTPVITIVEGNWYIDGVDTGVSATGLAGVSIVWKGELAEAPSSPQENWAYFNTVDRTSYIWNVTANKWDILAQSGPSTPQVPAATLILSDTKKIMYWPGEAFVFTDADIIGWLYNGHILTNLLDKTHNITLNGDPISNGDPVPTASGEYEIIVTHWSGRSSTFTITIYNVMVWIPAGTFTMGSNAQVSGLNEASPPHQVTLTSSFYMSKYEVTQELYQAVMGSNPSNFSSNPAADELQGRRPVEKVSWYDAIVFCNRLSIAEDLSPAYRINNSTDPSTWGTVPTSRDETWDAVTIVSGSTGYRLPTEAQWEYACRAGSTTLFYWGDQPDEQYQSYRENSGGITREVGKKLPNAFGLYDMSGNVYEWCWDWYSDYTDTAKTDPVGASSGSDRVIRGGSVQASINRSQSVNRVMFNRSERDPYIGFRVLRPYLGDSSSATYYTATANGNTSITTTHITLNFSADPVGLTINDITLGGSITKGSATLSGSGTSRTISGFTVNSSGNATIAITRSGIESGQKSVPVLVGSGSLHEMVWIPAGSFQMGQTGIATPVHQVTLTSGFYMGKYQVTQEQYQAVMGSNPSYFNGGWGREPASDEIQGRRPVEQVSWYDAIVFCNWLSIAEGLSPAYRINGSTNPNTWGTVPTSSDETWNAVTILSGSTGYRLPTEAQWEYACRAGSTTAYYWGNQTDAATVGQYAWYSSNSNSRTHEVGEKLPNAWGLYDMSGNIWEWCWDWIADYTNTAKTNPTGASSGSGRVLRGGCWIDGDENLQSANRLNFAPNFGSDVTGFRVLRP